VKLEWIYALWGGALIGTAVSFMLLLNGRVTGISGIIYGLLKPVKGDIAWRYYFVIGLLMGGMTMFLLRPEAFQAASFPSDWLVGIAGLLVGFGTVLGSGCTSGHGVCGISRMSARSMVSTLLFIAVGIFMGAALRWIGVFL
jgi:uncharacterized membrane protein YedE/YeeE